MSARNTSPALGAFVAVLAAFTIAGCNPGGGAPSSADAHANGQAAKDAGTDLGANQTSGGARRATGEPAGNRGAAGPPELAPGELLVKFKAGTPTLRIAAALPRASVVSVRSFALVPGLRHVKLAPGVALDKALEDYRARPDVEYAEPNYIVHIDALPNDPRFAEQWGLNNTGQTGGLVNADLDAPEAWNLTQGDSSVVVAIIDTGVDYTHPDLAANIYSNTLECTPNGLDDDGNGYVDDCHGIDAVNDDADPADDNLHGTHVAGIIGAVGNNGIGISGVAWNVKILPCKFLDASGTGSTADALECLDYVAALVAHGVNIVATNNSWGGGAFSQALADAIAVQRQRGVLFITAAGNARSDHDHIRGYPCDFDSPNIVCVAMTDDTDAIGFFSDFGRRSVHVGAPGVAILSTLPGGTYGELDGTSMATPHVTGIAALLKADNPARDWRAIRNLILAGGKPNGALATKTITGHEVSAFGSLTCSNSTVLERLWPVVDVPVQHPGTPITLRMLHINCASPNGAPTVSVSPGGDTVVLHDDGLDGDAAANDGEYSATWTSLVPGTYTLSFPDGSTSDVTFDAQLRSGFPFKTQVLATGAFIDDTRIHTLVGNIDADPEPEIIRAALSLGQLYAWNQDGTLVSGFPTDPILKDFDIGVAYPVLGRFTGDAHLGVFANYTAQLRAAYSGDGQMLAGWPLFTNSLYAASAADLDGDGFDEILAEGNDNSPANYLQIYRPNATNFPAWPITLPASSASSRLRTPAVADLDGDGELEIITADNERLYAHHTDGHALSGFPVSLPVRSYPAIGDVDGDGAPEIVVVSRAEGGTPTAIINIVSNTGLVERTIVTPFRSLNDNVPALADLDDDGIPEIVIQFGRTSFAGGLGAWRSDGTPLPGWPLSIDEAARSSAVVGDVDGDGAPDIVVMAASATAWFDELRAYDRTGHLLAGFPKRLPSQNHTTPAIADLDLDGRNEIIASTAQWMGYDGRYDTVWAFDLGGPAGNARIEWGQFMNDERHSGFYETGKNLATTAYLTTQIRGTGSITSSPAGIACGTDCIEKYPKGTSVTLTAGGGTFGSWRGACAGRGNPCVVSVQDYTTVLALFGAVTLSVNVSGSGTVTSAPAGITCPGTCSESFGAGITVTLMASPQADALFSGWSGACSGQATSCTVTMDAAKTVNATFSPKPTLSVSTLGMGSGTVSSSPAGINCGGDCSNVYDVGTVVTLTASPAPGSTFDGWGNACLGSGATTCAVTMNDSLHVTATFNKEIFNLILSKTGTGTGSVVSNPPGIDCGADCTEGYAQGTTLVLTARPDAGSAFVGWSGACSGNELTCTLPVNGPLNVTANFAQLLPSFALSVSKTGTGDGTVTSLPAGIECGVDCSESYTQDVFVTLSAVPKANSVFGGWAGSCAVSGTTCSVKMSAAQSVIANFTLKPTLSVALSGNGVGTVTSGDGGVMCGTDCTESYTSSAVVTLTATAAQGSLFEGWSGACSGTVQTCSVTLSDARSVTASFVLKSVLTVALSGGGTGTVSSVDGGVACGSDCTESYGPTVSITLNAVPAQGSAFDGWSGACSGQSTSCTVTMEASKSVGASFRVAPPSPPSGGGGGGGGGRLDWTVLAVGAALLLLRLRRARASCAAADRVRRPRAPGRWASTCRSCWAAHC